ncbi:MAG: hypothetical protein WA152_00340 [Microgenomates group bacterium]
MADVKRDQKLDSLADPILGRLEGDALASEQAKNYDANVSMTVQVAGKMQSRIDAQLLEKRRTELQSGFTNVQEIGRDTRDADREAMATIEAENAAKNTVQPKKGLFGWGFLGL